MLLCSYSFRYCLSLLRTSIGRCWNYTELCSNLLATNHLWKVVRHQNALDFHLLMILANIRLKLLGKVEDWKKESIVCFSEIATNGKKFSTYLRKALLQGLKLRLFISSKVLESKAATKAIKIQGIIKRTIISLKRKSI